MSPSICKECLREYTPSPRTRGEESRDPLRALPPRDLGLRGDRAKGRPVVRVDDFLPDRPGLFRLAVVEIPVADAVEDCGAISRRGVLWRQLFRRDVVVVHEYELVIPGFLDPLHAGADGPRGFSPFLWTPHPPQRHVQPVRRRDEPV